MEDEYSTDEYSIVPRRGGRWRVNAVRYASLLGIGTAAVLFVFTFYHTEYPGGLFILLMLTLFLPIFVAALWPMMNFAWPYYYPTMLYLNLATKGVPRYLNWIGAALFSHYVVWEAVLFENRRDGLMIFPDDHRKFAAFAIFAFFMLFWISFSNINKYKVKFHEKVEY